MPERNVEWTKIPPRAKVRLEGKPGTRYYVVEMGDGKGLAVAFWGSQDAREAQRALDQRCRDRRR